MAAQLNQYNVIGRVGKDPEQGTGNLTEGLTVFERKDGNVMRRVGIGVCHRRLAAPDAAFSITSL
jgi:hypothetical protein